MIEEMRRCAAMAPPHVRIRKWRVSYSEALGLANELHDMRSHAAALQSSADILMTIVDGNMTMFNIPVVVKLVRGMAYPIDRPSI